MNNQTELPNYSQLPEITISYKNKTKPSDRFLIKNSHDANNALRILFDADLIEYRMVAA